jgi:hypothetical protein
MNVAHPKKAFNWCEALSCRLGRVLRADLARISTGKSACRQSSPRLTSLELISRSREAEAPPRMETILTV